MSPDVLERAPAQGAIEDVLVAEAVPHFALQGAAGADGADASESGTTPTAGS